jgi:hypothetical protein
MSGRITAGLCLVSLALLGLWAVPATASLLDTGTAFNDGVTTWRGTSVFPATPDPILSGSIDWVVYAPGQFPFSGYAPTANEYTYVYQLHSTGSAPITNFSVPLENYADNIGTFIDTGHGMTGIDTVTDGANLFLPPGGFASWDFNGVGQDQSSCGLVFSSPRMPFELVGVVINHGENRSFTIPSPSAHPVPEPAMIWGLLSGLAMLAATWLRRRR